MHTPSRLIAILLILSCWVHAGWGEGRTGLATELTLLAEHPVDGMAKGNLSGLARCAGIWYGVSDSEDTRLYRLLPGDGPWQAVRYPFAAPEPPDAGLPAYLKVPARTRGFLMDGHLDLEGIACDAAGNRFLVSEAYATVLRVGQDGSAAWLDFPADLVARARDLGLLQRFNALYEGVAVNPEGTRLWLAAERQGRGILRVDLDGEGPCADGCILLAEDKRILSPPALGERELAADFSALAMHGGKLFTLERLAHRLCRRDPDTAAVEHCWSFAATVLAPRRLYDTPFGMAEALWLDDEGAWIGVDNNEQLRADGEVRPVIWQFAPPPRGWLAVEPAPSGQTD